MDAGAGGLLASAVTKLGMAATSDYASIVSINLFVALLCACIVVGHLLEENRWMNESITALLIGLGTGVVILLTTKGRSSHVLVFSEDLFFIYLLPPIIFNAGYAWFLILVLLVPILYLAMKVRVEQSQGQ